MNPDHEKLLEDFEAFQLDLEVEAILKKVKTDRVPDQSVTQFAEQLKERERQKHVAQAERQAQVQQQWSPGHYLQLTSDWFVQGLDYCCDYWRYQKRLPQTRRRPRTKGEDGGNASPKTGSKHGKKARYRARYPEKVAAYKKRYRENNRAKIAEARKRYNDTHREQRQEYQRQYINQSEERRAYVRRYWIEHREHILAKQRAWWHRTKEKRQTQKKLQALGSKTLRVVLTDYRKSPSVNVHPPVVSYLKEFCQSLEAEGPASVVPFTSVETYIESFCQTLEPGGDSLTLTDLDSGDIHAMDQHVWDKDVDQWLNDLMAMLEDPSSLEYTLDVHDLLEDMSPEDGEHVIDDMMDSFDLDAFVS